MAYIVRVHACAQVLIRREMQGRTACHEVHIRHRAELHHIAHIIQQSAMRLGGHTKHGVILTIIVLNGTNQAIIAIAELLVGWLHGYREVVSTQINTCDSRTNVRLRCIPTRSRRRIHIESLEIAIRHVIARKLGIIVTRSTHTRVRNHHIIRIKIAREDSTERARCILCLRGELR